MKVGNRLKKQIVQEWSDFYIDYDLCLSIISPLRSYYRNETQIMPSKLMLKNPEYLNKPNKYYIENNWEETLLPIKEEEDTANLLSTNIATNYSWNFSSIKQKFFVQWRLEIEKFNFFIKENYTSRYKVRYDQILEQLNFIKMNKEYGIFNNQWETSFKSLYRDLSIFQKFIKTNIWIKQRIISKFIKYSSSKEPFTDVNNIVHHAGQVWERADQLNQNLMKDSENQFSYFFYQKYNTHPIKVLKGYLENVTFTADQAFFLGIIIGFLILLLNSIIALLFIHGIDMDRDREFRSIFPMFRTFGILILYWWTLGLNVWAWDKAQIKYKALFAFDNHYSTVIEICKRSAFFTWLLFIALVIYIIIHINIPLFSFLNNNVSIGILPLICWATLLIYFFCPFKIWNYKGRFYTMKLFIETIANIFMPVEFRHIWFMDQWTSWIGPMRDIEYTLCYYSYYMNPLAVREAYCSNNRTIYLFIAIFPNFIRVLQCSRQIYDTKKLMPWLNIGKYTFNIIVATFSFLYTFHPIYFKFWLVFAFISGCYSSIWDIKMDFGFFEKGPNYPLRNKWTYKKHYFYYYAIVINIILRFLWVLSVSPEIMSQMIRPEFLALILFTLEMLRRGQWNFIRVEYEHLDLIKKYQISYMDELPFIKEHGQFIVNHHNLVSILNFEKEDKIKMELKQIYSELNKRNSRQRIKRDKDWSQKFEELIEKYKEKTRKNVENN